MGSKLLECVGGITNNKFNVSARIDYEFYIAIVLGITLLASAEEQRPKLEV